MAAPNPESKYIYKILPSAPPSPLPTELPISSTDTNDGFIHLSTASQVPLTAGRFFKDNTAIWLLKMESKVLGSGKGELKWEDKEGHGIFPHLYGAPIEGGQVAEVLAFERQEGKGWYEILSGLED